MHLCIFLLSMYAQRHANIYTQLYAETLSCLHPHKHKKLRRFLLCSYPSVLSYRYIMIKIPHLHTYSSTIYLLPHAGHIHTYYVPIQSTYDTYIHAYTAGCSHLIHILSIHIHILLLCNPHTGQTHTYIAPTKSTYRTYK